jgi:hypothetical protein
MTKRALTRSLGWLRAIAVVVVPGALVAYVGWQLASRLLGRMRGRSRC